MKCYKVMQFLQQLFKKNKTKQEKSPYKKKQSWLTALCSSKPSQLDQKVYPSHNKFEMENSMSKNMKFQSTSTDTSPMKQNYKVSFSFQNEQFMELQSDITNIIQRKFTKLDLIMKRNELYGVVSSQKDPLSVEVDCLWLKIGKNEQINSLVHIQAYRFQKIFMIPDELGFQYPIQQIAACNQTICMRLKNYKQVQHFISLWEKQLIKSFAFRPIEVSFNKLTVSVYKIGRHMWLNFNQPVNSQKLVKELLQKVGFHSSDPQYQILLQEIPKGLTLQEYIQILKKKEKLETEYEGSSVKQFLRHKFLQKMSKSRQINFQSQEEDKFQNQISRSNTGGQYADYFNAINSQNVNKKEQIKEFQDKINQISDEQEQQDQIFNFNVYKDQSDQQIKGVAIIKQRKNRSKSQQITNFGKAVHSDYSEELDPCFYQNQ